MSATALGVDFFSGNTMVWEQAVLHPPDFAIIGATTGLQSYYEKYGGRPFVIDWAECERRQIARSGYHFYIEGINVVQQAAKFLSVVRAAGGRENFPLVLDIETTSELPIPRAEGIRNWLIEISIRTGKQAMIYTSAEMWSRVLGNVDWAVDYEIWLAGYPDRQLGWHEPNFSYKVAIPEPWKSAGKSWSFWQYGSGGRDLDTFRSSLPDFKAYCEAYKSGAIPPGNGVPPVAVDKAVVVNTTTLNVRTQPTTSAPALFQFHLGQKLVVDTASATQADGHTWVRVEAWVAQEYLTDVIPPS
jgi:GH25 family lysozyme M1 (1,4-beta-N-acetylmuramidase)